MTDEQQPQNTEETYSPLLPQQVIEQETATAARRMPVARQLAILGIVLLALLSISAVPEIIENLTPEQENVPQELAATNTQPIEDLSAHFADISIQAESAFVWDVQQQRALYQKNPDEQMPIASITKLMTALVAYEVMGRDEQVLIPVDAIAQDGDSGLLEGERFSFGTLSDLTLMTSSNDGAYAIAASAGSLLSDDAPAEHFVEAMNIRAEDLGLTQTYFRNPTGLDITETEAGAFGSARDIAFLVEYILEHTPEIIDATGKESELFFDEDGRYHDAENTNVVVESIPGIIGSKTGYTTLSGGNLVVAFDVALNRPIIAVVLGSTYNGRFADVQTLADAAQGAE